jgi:hypothetical protein
MSTSYSFTKTVSDESLFFSYVAASFPTLTGISSSGPTLRLTFSTTLSGAQQTALTTLLGAYPNPVCTEDGTLANILVLNTTAAPLAGGGVFTGGWQDVARFSCVRVTCLSDVASAASGVSLQFGVAAQQADVVRTYTASAGAVLACVSDVAGRYFRLVYTNGAAAQTAFSVCARWTTSNEFATVQLGSATLTDQSDALVTRSVVAARSDNSRHLNLRADEQSQLRVCMPTILERLVCATSTPMIQVSFTYTVNSDQTVTAVVGAGSSVTANLGRALVTAGAVVNSSASLSTDRMCRCTAGNTVTVVVGCAFGAPVAGNTQICGAGNASNGLFFGYNGTSFGILVRSNGTSTWTPSSAFNLDPIDGTGPSSIALTPTFGNTYVIRYDTLGWGGATFMITPPVSVTTANPGILTPECVAVHRVSFGNTQAAVGIMNPQFPAAAVCANTTNATAVTMAISSFACFLDGPVNRVPLLRSVDIYKTVTTTSYVPLMVIYNKPTFRGVANTSTIHLRELSLSLLGGSQNLYICVFNSPTINGASYTDVSTNTSVAAVSTSTMSMTAGTGISLWSGTVYSNDNTFTVEAFDMFLLPGDTFCIAAKLSANKTVNTSLCVTFAEFM